MCKKRETLTRFNLQSSQDEFFQTPILQNLAAFLDSSFQQGLIPPTLWTPTSRWKGQSSSQADHKWVERGWFLHITCPQLPAHAHPQGWCRHQGSQRGTSSQLEVALFQSFPFTGELKPSTDFLSYLLGLPPAGSGRAGLLMRCCRQSRHQRANKSLLPTHCWPLTSPAVLMVWKVIPNGTSDF